MQSRLLSELRPDEPLRMTATYVFDDSDRRKIDNQILAIQSLLSTALLTGVIGGYFRASPNGAELKPRDVVCFEGVSNFVTLATPDALAATGGRALGVVVLPSAPGGVVCVAISGVLPPELSRIDTPGNVGPDANGVLAAGGSPVIGKADFSGRVFLGPDGSGGGGGPSPSNATPATLGAPAQAGVSDLYSRGDHRHAHGDQAGGTLHEVANDVTAGFMSPGHVGALDTATAVLDLLTGPPVTSGEGGARFVCVLEDGSLHYVDLDAAQGQGLIYMPTSGPPVGVGAGDIDFGDGKADIWAITGSAGDFYVRSSVIKVISAGSSTLAQTIQVRPRITFGSAVADQLVYEESIPTNSSRTFSAQLTVRNSAGTQCKRYDGYWTVERVTSSATLTGSFNAGVGSLAGTSVTCTVYDAGGGDWRVRWRVTAGAAGSATLLLDREGT